MEVPFYPSSETYQSLIYVSKKILRNVLKIVFVSLIINNY